MSAVPNDRARVTLYMRAADAEALAVLLEDLHHETRLDKVDVLAAMVATVRSRRPEILAKLNRHAGARRPGNGRVSA